MRKFIKVSGTSNNPEGSLVKVEDILSVGGSLKPEAKSVIRTDEERVFTNDSADQIYSKIRKSEQVITPFLLLIIIIVSISIGMFIGGIAVILPNTNSNITTPSSCFPLK